MKIGIRRQHPRHKTRTCGQAAQAFNREVIFVSDVQKDKHVTEQRPRAIDPAEVRNNHDNPAAAGEPFTTLLQKLNRVVDMLENVMEVNQVSRRPGLVMICQCPLVNPSNAPLFSGGDQFRAVFKTANLMAVSLENIQCATGPATEFTHVTTRLKPILRQSQDLFPVSALPLEVTLDVGCSRIHRLKEVRIKIFQAGGIQIGVDSSCPASRTHNKGQRQPVSIDFREDNSRRFTAGTSRAFEFVRAAAKPRSDFSD